MVTDDKADDDKNRSIKNIDSGKNNDNSITLSKQTFYKLAIIGIIGLMTAAFFGGYSLHNTIYPHHL